MKNILAIYTICVLLLFAGLASACDDNVNCKDEVRVHAVDSYGNDLEGVVVAPEWKFSFTGWNDFAPKDKTTDADGIASSNFWVATQGETLQINYATLDGYTCTRGDSTKVQAVCGINTLTTVCTSNDVPEFGVIAGAVALVGALGIFMYRRK